MLPRPKFIEAILVHFVEAGRRYGANSNQTQKLNINAFPLYNSLRHETFSFSDESHLLNRHYCSTNI